jgi:DNA polymerase-3 subunit gamma/tau
VGQRHITQTLSNQIGSGKISHAYLFCGIRGTGKTTVAKIFARAINGGSAEIDIFEIDAASNNSVQDVRDIIEKVKFPPMVSKYKVYIIDEVHMFSGSAFNAFLKTLEEPPAHAVFILCTTEPHKLLPTVQSRCLRFDFRAVPTSDIEKVITAVLKKENITATKEAINLIAAAGNGSFRDALSVTETVAAYCGTKEITAHAVADILGTVPEEDLKKLLTHISAGDKKSIISTVDKIFSNGINANTLVKSFLSVLRAELLNNTAIAPIFKTFAELEITIKNSVDQKGHFENAALLSAIKV